MKRYRLKIPDMIRREDAKMADKLDGHSIVTSNSFGSNMFIQETQCSCKREWLEEIDEPMSAEEFAASYCGYQDQGRNGEVIEIFEAGAAENEKKHRLQQSFGEWWSDNAAKYNMKDAQEIWQAHAKATNTEA